MPKNSNYTTEQRKIDLESHIENLDFNGKSYSKADLLKYLKSKGHDIVQKTLENDLKELANNNKFVANIGMYYSKYMEDRYKSLERIQRNALKIYEKKWTSSKQVKKQILGRNGQLVDTIETTTTKEIASPKLTALKLVADIEQMKIELASGNNLNISAQAWGMKEAELQLLIKELQLKITELTKTKEVIIIEK